MPAGGGAAARLPGERRELSRVGIMAEALYRKYRPQIFEDVVGQEHIERTIKNAIEQDKVSHAYLFCGPRGTGKTTTARLLAKALLCERGPTSDPDGTCEDCTMIADGRHPDVYELDAASRTGVENVREEIIGRVQFAPTRGRYKVYIIDEVHMLSNAAFNALLKTLEEPPSHVVFILCTTDPQQVPETIHSRCQRFDFRRISNEAMVSRLGAICVSENVEFEGDALDLIAHRAEGGMRNALTSLEQVIAFGEGRVTLANAEQILGSLDVSELGEIVKLIGTRDVAGCFRWTAEFVETGSDLARFTRDLAEHLRNMYVMALAGEEAVLDVSESVRRELAGELPLFGPDRLARLLGVLGDLTAELKSSTNQRLSFEIALTRMVRPDSDLTLESLAERIEALEAGYSAVAHVVSSPSAGTAHALGAGAGAAQGAAGAGAGVGASVAGASAAGVVRADEAGATRGAVAADGSARVQRDAMPAAAERAAARDERDVARPAAFAGSSSAAMPSTEGSGISSAAETPMPAASSAAPQPASTVAAGASAGAGAGATGGIPPQLLESMRNPAGLQRMWQATLAHLKKAKAAYGVLFLNTKAVLDEAAGALVVEFPAANDFAFKAVQKPDVQDELSAAITQTLGAPVPFRLSKAGQGAAGSIQSTVQGAAQSAARAAAAATQPAAARETAPAAASAQAVAQPVATDDVARFEAQPAGAAPTAARAAQRREPAPWEDAPAVREEQTPRGAGSASQPAQAAFASAPANDWDEVPVDLYEDMVPYGDDAYDGPYAMPAASQPAVAAQPAGSARSQGADAGRGAGAPSVSDAREGVPSGGMPAASAGAAPTAGATARAASASDAASGAAPASGAVVQPSAAASASAVRADEPTLADLDAMLAYGFGEGASFAEVRE